MRMELWTSGRANHWCCFLICIFLFGLSGIVFHDMHDNADKAVTGPCFGYKDDGMVTSESTSGFSLKMDPKEVRNPKHERTIEYEGQTYTVK